jgi:two-component system, cell cycle sensor histidine kinase and response regulator CckA
LQTDREEPVPRKLDPTDEPSRPASREVAPGVAPATAPPSGLAERKRAEEALHASEQKFRTMAAHAPIMIGVTDRDGAITFLNQAWLDFRGRTLEEEAGWGWAAGLHPDDRERVCSEMESAIRDGQPYSVEYRIQNRHGEYRWLLDSASPLLDAEGRPDGYVGTAVDITERRQAHDLLQQSERRFRALVEHGADAITLLARDGTVVYEGPTVERITGFTAAERAGMDGFEHVHPDDLGVVRAAFGRLIAQPGAVEHALFRAFRANGEVWWAEATATNLLEEPAVQAIVVNYHDVSERVRAESERLELQRRLLHAQKLESLGVLAGGIAHDFNNMLTGILGSLDLALLGVAVGSPAHAHVERAIQATCRAADLTRQMLAYSGKGRFVVTVVDLNQLARQNADLFRTVVSRTADFLVDLCPRPCLVEADPGQLQQVVMNLITNASEALEGQHGRITLRTGAEEFDEKALAGCRLDTRVEPGHYAFVEVSDSGVGMNDATQQRIFEPFFTTKFSGRGLGMAAVLGIVRAHKGAILVNSAPGRGTRIQVLFPTHTGVAAEPPSQAAPAPAQARQGLVLVVDDEELVRTACVAYLQELGYESIAAASGDEALELFGRMGGDVACVILDLTMPGISSVAVHRELQRLQPGLPVLVSSGFDEPGAMRAFGANPPAGFLPKPYLLEDLRARLDAVLGDTGR